MIGGMEPQVLHITEADLVRDVQVTSIIQAYVNGGG